ncbi:MAG: HAMP domain-containing histidine kinase [Ruminococcaceae bacterium]|nr:HAMP domain-containing histidine kinase [Oscillospiraceae bacterium]
MERLSSFLHAHGKQSIARRWMMNTMLVIVIVLITVNVCIYYLVKQYFYGSAESYLISEANAEETIMARLYDDSTVNWSTGVRQMIENFEKRDQIEMMSINQNGEVSMSSSGFTPKGPMEMPDYEMAKNGEDGRGVFIGREGGENIIAVTVMLSRPTSNYGAFRLVSSLTLLDSQLSRIMFIALAISVFVLLIAIMMGLYFVKSICVPLARISSTAKKLAKGDFSERIPVTSGDEIGQLSMAFNDMANDLENSEQIKNDFISSVSHELRTPLTAIKGWSETLAMGYDPETFSKGMKVITGETLRLEQMVEELLDFSRIQSGHFTLQMAAIDVIAELEDALLLYNDKAKKEHKTLSYNNPEFMCAVTGDKSRLRQVFINVLDNAVKYTEEGGQIDVMAEKTDTNVVVIVTDTGCGIAPEDLPKIKQKFYKANSTKRGSGIGLAVADEIITLHGGSLEAESKPGVGTRITIVLPLTSKKERTDDE